MWTIIRTLGAIHRWIDKSVLLDGNPEWWHKIAMTIGDFVEKYDFILRILWNSASIEHEDIQQTTIGNVVLHNKIWLAAGFAKQPHGLKTWEALGFWFLSIGWVTKEEQPGNPKPRLFRYYEELSAINRLWLPWPGVKTVVSSLLKRIIDGKKPNAPVFANLCNNASTKPEWKTQEFLDLMTELYPYVDGFEINISCPNQHGVCDLQNVSVIDELVKAITEHNRKIAQEEQISPKVILVKVAPLTKHETTPENIQDQTKEWLKIIADVCNKYGVDAVIANNTSKEHDGIPKDTDQVGWLSGELIAEQSIETIKFMREHLDANIKIIWVGGVTPDNVQKFLDAWADAVQMYTSMVYDISAPYKAKLKIQEWIKRKWQTAKR